MTTLPSIPEFYRDKNVFITGGSGFIGKVLVEKLLRSCSTLKNIYLLMKEKKGKSPEERLQTITDLPLFDVLKQQQPEALKKIRIVEGDLTQLGLGLSPEDTKLLIDEVNIVFHGAASIRFDDSLTDAVILNTRGTREVVNLALEMKKLDVFVHISTTYCNTDRPVIEEKFYPPQADWKKTIEVAENVDRHTLDVLTPKYIYPSPNNYIFTKSLAEGVVHDLCKGKVPTVVFRPSIVISTLNEPVQGWTDNFNGPVGLLVGSGKGIVRTFYADPDLSADYIPVDALVKGLIISSWKQATYEDLEKKFTPCFYHGSQYDLKTTTIGETIEMGKKIADEEPLDNILWYRGGGVTKCYYNYFIRMIFFQILPAIIVDTLLKILGHKPLLLKIQRRIYNANRVLHYFVFNQWKFINEKALKLEKELLPCDNADFTYGIDDADVYQYFKNAAKGGKKYLLKETGDYESARRHTNRMKIVSQVFNFVWYLTLFWFVFFKIDIISYVLNKVYWFFDL